MGKYQAYPEYKDSGIDWIGDIPEHWIVAELKRYAWVQGGYAFSSDSFVDSGIPVIRIGDIKQDGTISLESCKYIKDAVSIQYRNFEVHSGDLLMAMTGATIGKAGWFKGSQRALLNQRVGSFKCNKSFLNYKFFWYVLNSLGYQEHIRITAFGGAQPNISDTGMVSYQSAIPDLIEQENIAHFLDHETAKIDTLIDKQQQLIQLLKEKRQAVISHAVTKGLNSNAPMRDSGVEWLGEVPEHWVVTRLKYQVKMLPGFAFKSSGFVDSPEEVNLLRGINIAPGRTRWDDVVYWPRHDHDDLSEYALQEKDLVLGMDRPWVGDGLRLAMISSEDLPAYVVQRVARIRGVDGISQEYLFNLLSSPSFASYFDPITTGVSVPHISTDQIGEYCFALPSESEREDIVEFISSSISKYKKLIRGAESAIELMQERRTALISAAVTGKIDVRHPVCHPTDDLQSSKSAVHGDL